MKLWVRIAIIAAVVVAGVLIYFVFNPSAPQNAAEAPAQNGSNNFVVSPAAAPVIVSGTVPASSYGAGAVGTRTATSVTLSAPVSSTELATLLGQAKPAPGSGAHPDFSKIKAVLYDPKTDKLLASTALGADGSYKFIVEPGEYVLNTVPAGLSGQLPQRIAIASGQVVNVNFFVK